MKFLKKINQVHIILHACPWSVKYILVRKYILNHKMGEKKYWWWRWGRGEEGRIRKHTHTHAPEHNLRWWNKWHSSPNIWAQMWGRQLRPITKIIWLDTHTFIKPELKWKKVKSIVSFGNIFLYFHHTKQLNHKPEFLLHGYFWNFGLNYLPHM